MPGLAAAPHTGTWSSPVQILGRLQGCARDRTPGAAAACAGLCFPGAPGSVRCVSPSQPGIAGCVAVDKVDKVLRSGWVWGLFAIELASPSMKEGAARSSLAVLGSVGMLQGTTAAPPDSSQRWRRDPR